MKVLIAVDGSDDSFSATRQVGQLLSHDRDQVALFYSPPAVHVGGSSAPAEGIIRRAQKALADSVFDAARERLPEQFHSSLNCITGHLRPRDGILAAADDSQADLIVVGARGLGPIRRAILGSVSHAVAHSATVPVFVARDNEKRTAAESYRVLVALDQSQASKHTVEMMEQLTFPGHTIGRAVTVIESMFAGHVPDWLEKKARDADSEAMAQAWVRQHDQERQQAHDMLTALIGQLPDAFHGQDPIVREGHPGEQILKTIADEVTDLVVVGSRDHGMIERIFVGSTSQSLLAHAPCSVLLVREPVRSSN